MSFTTRYFQSYKQVGERLGCLCARPTPCLDEPINPHPIRPQHGQETTMDKNHATSVYGGYPPDSPKERAGHFARIQGLKDDYWTSVREA